MYPWGPSPGSCSICSMWIRQGRKLCPNCVCWLNKSYGQKLVWPHPLQPKIRCRALFDWIPGESDQLSAALVTLKGRGARRNWDELAKAFLRAQACDLWRAGLVQVQGQAITDREICLWPVPSSSPDRCHASDFADALAQILGCTVHKTQGLSAFDLKVQSPQKALARSQRLKRLQAVGPEQHPVVEADSSQKLHIVVDDILTTGATSLFTVQTLKAAKFSEVWCLARRSRLAP